MCAARAVRLPPEQTDMRWITSTFSINWNPLSRVKPISEPKEFAKYEFVASCEDDNLHLKDHRQLKLNIP